MVSAPIGAVTECAGGRGGSARVCAEEGMVEMLDSAIHFMKSFSHWTKRYQTKSGRKVSWGITEERRPFTLPETDR